MSDRTPTFAEVCHAIAEGQISATIEGSVYQVNALELRRYLNKNRLHPLISSSSRTIFRKGTPARSWPNGHFFV
jgi:hypothetical protein